MHDSSLTLDLVGGAVVLLLIAVAVLALCNRLKWPFTVMLVVVGMVLAAMAGPVEALRPLVAHKVTSDVILAVLLPTLVFESAFHLDVRGLRHNLLAIFTLAVPGLILSTGLIGLLVGALTPLGWIESFLLGAILSATDPVAVVALFKKLGAPKQLTILVEGESLFNDATSLVMAQILLGVLAAGVVTFGSVVDGAGAFLRVFFGGIAAGGLLAWGTGWLLGKVRNDPFIEITLTLALAYGSFLVAEELLHVSGVMAVVVAGLVMGSWGKTKVSPQVGGFLSNIWDYAAFLANASIFLMVGLRVELPALFGSWDLMIWVVFAMLVSRAVIVYGLMPLVGRFSQHGQQVPTAYRHVLYWGALRGAIALAIALSLTFDQGDLFVTLVMGAVLFTLLGQGLTMGPLVAKLGLDVPSLADRLARVYSLIAAKHHALDLLPRLRESRYCGAEVTEQFAGRLMLEKRELEEELKILREQRLDAETEWRLLMLRAFVREKSFLLDLFGRGQLSEGVFRDLAYSLDQQADAMRLGQPLPAYTLHDPDQSTLWARLTALPHFFVNAMLPSPERMRKYLLKRFELAWARYHGCATVLSCLEAEAGVRGVPPQVAARIGTIYSTWKERASSNLEELTRQFPQFVADMQKRQAERLLAEAEHHSIETDRKGGVIAQGMAETVLQELDSYGLLLELENREVSHLPSCPANWMERRPRSRVSRWMRLR